MANTILTKRSSTASNVPTAGEVEVGELAINTADKKLFSKHGSTVITLFDGVYAPLASPNFSGTATFAAITTSGVLNLGHASDTTIARNAAGKVEIENKPIIKHTSTSYESGEVTFSTSAPSGGSNGDIWFRYT